MSGDTGKLHWKTGKRAVIETKKHSADKEFIIQPLVRRFWVPAAMLLLFAFGCVSYRVKAGIDINAETRTITDLGMILGFGLPLIFAAGLGVFALLFNKWKGITRRVGFYHEGVRVQFSEGGQLDHLWKDLDSFEYDKFTLTLFFKNQEIELLAHHFESREQFSDCIEFVTFCESKVVRLSPVKAA